MTDNVSEDALAARRGRLAQEMVLVLPVFGRWASAMRDFETPYGKAGIRQLEVLYMLRHDLLDGSKPTATALAERFQIQRSVVTRILAKLETGGHIIRGTDPRDGRAQQITITENGKHLSDFVEQEYFQEMKRALGEIEARDIECMERSLEILTGVAVDLGMGEAARRINELSDR